MIISFFTRLPLYNFKTEICLARLQLLLKLFQRLAQNRFDMQCIQNNHVLNAVNAGFNGIRYVLKASFERINYTGTTFEQNAFFESFFEPFFEPFFESF